MKRSPALTLNWVLLGIPDDEDDEGEEDRERRDAGLERMQDQEDEPADSKRGRPRPLW